MSEKISVMVFMPVGVCSCSQTGFLGRIYDAVKKYRDSIAYREYSAESELAKQYGVGYRGVVVGTKSLGPNPSTATIEAAILKEIQKQGIETA